MKILGNGEIKLRNQRSCQMPRGGRRIGAGRPPKYSSQAHRYRPETVYAGGNVNKSQACTEIVNLSRQLAIRMLGDLAGRTASLEEVEKVAAAIKTLGAACAALGEVPTLMRPGKKEAAEIASQEASIGTEWEQLLRH
jgi:hypothetical protein